MTATVEDDILMTRDRLEILFALSIVKKTLMMSSNTKNITAAAARNEYDNNDYSKLIIISIRFADSVCKINDKSIYAQL